MTDWNHAEAMGRMLEHSEPVPEQQKFWHGYMLDTLRTAQLHINTFQLQDSVQQAEQILLNTPEAQNYLSARKFLSEHADKYGYAPPTGTST